MDIETIVTQVTRRVLSQISAQGVKMPEISVAGVIEHSIMNPDVTRDKILEGCKVAEELGLANICVTPYYVSLAADNLSGNGPVVCAAIAFPHGAATTAGKAAEVREAIKNGARELDVAMNILAVKNGNLNEARRDLEEIMSAADGRAIVKAIYEQSVYSDEEKVMALEIAKKAGVGFVKISNALSGKKAEEEDVRFVRRVLGEGIGIKIDGGISDAETVIKLLRAGANRVGTSRSEKIVRG